MLLFKRLLLLTFFISFTSYAEGGYLPGMSPLPTRQQAIDLAVLMIASSSPKVSEETDLEFMSNIEKTAGDVWDACTVAAKNDSFSYEHSRVTMAAKKTGNLFVVEQLGNVCSTAFMKAIADKHTSE
ncbi:MULTISPECIES: hypothetical protein [Citrobacter]|nr:MULTISPECIES: hypothetical protein [Citrobacter]MDW2597045.1 hypothetical protein [Citrobacter braakii]MDW2660756.1 hypothetical protein [Citrobacter braakii]MDW2708420.1 hypothetical protein [Citrobacter braakii]QLW41100.1 hypothetical protein HV229_11850 [Citrobacter sp. RHBSTW-00524]HEF0006714.1 hypothetical protein [Citrobacter braakii]